MVSLTAIALPNNRQRIHSQAIANTYPLGAHRLDHLHIRNQDRLPSDNA